MSELQFVQVDPTGRRLALTSSGSGTPTVVLETGLDAESAEWKAVQQEVAQFTRVIRYDRANRGQSDPALKPRSAQDFVADLHALLRAARVPGPYLLVGHSLGGVIVRLYTDHYPDDVVGLVLVDPMHEDQFERISPLIPPAFPGEPKELTQFRSFWTKDWRDPTMNTEGVDFVANQAQAHTIGALRDIPLRVLTADTFVRMVPPGGEAIAAPIQQHWRDIYSTWIKQSPNAQQILVETSGHFIQREQPEVVVRAIRDVVQAVRNQN